MDGLDYWRLCDQLSVIQAALLIAGVDPGENADVETWQTRERPAGYEAAKIAISNALRSGGIKGQITPQLDYEIDGDMVASRDDSIDLSESRVEVESLRSWLAGRGFRTGFFFPNATDEPDYLDPTHHRYAPKLAAAVHAWLATDESEIKNKSPKQALLRWLRQNAARYGLVDDEGKPNETGVEEIAKVANWQPGGGAPKTLAG